MILPIVAYGDPVLRKKAIEVNKENKNISSLIEDMFETMNKGSGVGLAAPQVGISLRIIVIDASSFADEDKNLENFKKVFINPVIVKKYGSDWKFNEGCLSIPNIREDIVRKFIIQLQYYDENFVLYDSIFDGFAARIIQHEYDHLEGKLFIDYLNPIRKRLLKRKLLNISQGNVNVNYKMLFPNLKKR